MAAGQGQKDQGILKRLLPHTLIMVAVFVYTIGGGYIFYWIEHPHRTASLEMATTTSVAPETTANTAAVMTTTFPYTVPTSTVMQTINSTVASTHAETSPPARTTLLNGFKWFVSIITNSTTISATTTTTTGFRPRPRRQADDYEDEDDNSADATKKKQCSRHALSVAVESARKQCVLANAPSKGKTDEFRAHMCATLLAQLSFCILKPGFKLEDTDGATTPVKTTLTTTPSPTTVFHTTTTSSTTIQSPLPIPIVHKQCESAVQVKDLTPSSYIFMAFTIISTIGYGHVAPVTPWGRVFCIVYGLFGIPLALLAIADQGRFLSAAIMFIFKKVKASCSWRYRRRGKGISGDSEEESMPALLLLVLFGAYLLIGGAVLTSFENDWSFIDAVYFTFISSSSIGFGDLLPQEGPYLPLTLFYVALGLALSTAAIDVFAGYLRRLHHFGKKIRNCANKMIWFGGQKVTLSQLVRNIGVQLGVSEDKITHLVEHFDEIVATTIEQAEGIQMPPTPSIAPLLMEEEKSPEPIPAFTCDVDFIDDKDDIIDEDE